MSYELRSLSLSGLLFAAALCMTAGQAFAWEVEIPQEEVQASVETMFPIRQQIPFATVVFSDPRVLIVEGSDRVRMGLAIDASFANQATAKGRAEIEGGLGYDPARGEFHLLRPAVAGLHFDGLPQEYLDLVRMMTNSITGELLGGIVVYRLDERDFRQGVMRRALKGVQIRDGKLIAELDW